MKTIITNSTTGTITGTITDSEMYLLVERDKETGMILRAIRTYYTDRRAKQDIELLEKYGPADALYDCFPIKMV